MEGSLCGAWEAEDNPAGDIYRPIRRNVLRWIPQTKGALCVRPIWTREGSRAESGQQSAPYRTMLYAFRGYD